MLNTEIKYKTSTDYDRLYELLKSGNLLVGFIAINIEGTLHMDYSKLVQMQYDKINKSFYLGFTFFESDFDKVSFNDLCKRENVRFIDLN